jgi:hypothetical protein
MGGMDSTTFLEWLNHEIEQIILEPEKKISVPYISAICQKAHDEIVNMSTEKQKRVYSLLESYWYPNSDFKYGNILDRHVENHIGGILATIFGFLEKKSD